MRRGLHNKKPPRRWHADGGHGKNTILFYHSKGEKAMKTQNFTIMGRFIEISGYLDEDGKPLYDAPILGYGMSWAELRERIKVLREDVDSIVYSTLEEPHNDLIRQFEEENGHAGRADAQDEDDIR